MASRSTTKRGRPAENRAAVTLRSGWLAAAIGMALALLTVAVIARSPTESLIESWIAPELGARLGFVGLAFYIVAIAFGSERLAGVASIPILAGALLGVDPDLGLPWSRALIIGCLWFGALEAGWTSIEFRHEARSTAAVARQRIQEAATVVMLAVLVGAGGVALSAIAPTRTLLVRASVIAAVLAAMAGALRHLQTTDPSTEQES